MTKTKKIQKKGLSFWTLEFGTWNLFEIWCLVLGIFSFRKPSTVFDLSH
jgi:hypothetical protein